MYAHASNYAHIHTNTNVHEQSKANKRQATDGTD